MTTLNVSTALFAEHEICIYGNPVLRKKAKSIEKFDGGLKKTVRDMLDTLHATGNGVGLAAPQVGLSEQIVVIDYLCPKELSEEGKEKEKTAWEKKMTPSFAAEAVLDGQEIVHTVDNNLEGAEKSSENNPAVSGNIFDIFPLVLINPKVSFLSDEQEDSQEGCLSLPGIRGVVERRRELAVEYQDENGKPHRLKCRGFLAKIVQHETDHLNGILYTDKLINGSLMILKGDPIWKRFEVPYKKLTALKNEALTEEKSAEIREMHPEADSLFGISDIASALEIIQEIGGKDGVLDYDTLLPQAK